MPRSPGGGAAPGAPRSPRADASDGARRRRRHALPSRQRSRDRRVPARGAPRGPVGPGGRRTVAAGAEPGGPRVRAAGQSGGGAPRLRVGRGGALNVEEYERMYRAEESQWWYAGMRAISFSLLDAAPAPAPGRFLDSGCGTGVNLSHLGRRGRAVGVDLSEEAIRFCRGRGVTAVRGSVVALPFGGGVFDCATSFDVLYHRWVADDAAAVRELARVLRAGGLLLLRVPALRMLWGAHDEAVHSRHRYTRPEVARLLAQAGFDVLRATY